MLKIVFLSLCLYSCHFSQVVINEVLANVPGSDRDYGYLEFVEIMNIGVQAVNLQTLTIYDLSDSNDVLKVVFPPGQTELLPNQLAVVIDPDYPFDVDPYEIVGLTTILTVESDKTIGNSLKGGNDCVFLMIEHDTVDQFCWNSDSGDGISWECINPYVDNADDNWGFCLNEFGSTPGRMNSIYSQDYSDAKHFEVIEDEISFNLNKTLKFKISQITSKSILRYACFDLKGFLKGWVCQGKSVFSETLIEWDGAFKGNKKLTPGVYIMYVELKGEENKKLIQHEFVFTVYE